jgi:hypothetical protein
MSRALVSPPPGDPEKPASSFFVPPPVQRLSRSFAGFTVSPSKPQSPSDRASNLPSLPSPSPLPGPNRAPGAADSPSSCKASTIFPRLHRLEIADDMAGNQEKPPLLDLKLSSTSFLDAVATDTEDNPLYAVETVGSSTTVWRSDPWDRSAKIADICWPKDLPLKGKSRDHTRVATIQMDGLRWRDTTALLKYSGLGRWAIRRCPYSCTALDRPFLCQLAQVLHTASSTRSQVEARRKCIRGMCLKSAPAPSDQSTLVHDTDLQGCCGILGVLQRCRHTTQTKGVRDLG